MKLFKCDGVCLACKRYKISCKGKTVEPILSDYEFDENLEDEIEEEEFIEWLLDQFEEDEYDEK